MPAIPTVGGVAYFWAGGQQLRVKGDFKIQPNNFQWESVSGQDGVHGRKRSGPGETFWQYRPYSFGDNVQQIDWHRSARSDRVFIRENEWEAAQSVWLWRDPSASMEYSSAGYVSGGNWPTKRDLPLPRD